MAVALKIRRKGILIIPKRLREEVNIKEGEEVSVEVKDGALLIRPLRPIVVDVDPNIVDELLREEDALERADY